MTPAERVAKDRAMATEMVARAKALPAGHVAGVAGNDLAHSERLCALVAEIAAEQGVDVSHVTFRPIDTAKLLAEHKRGGGR